jgi:hypothetical protein
MTATMSKNHKIVLAAKPVAANSRARKSFRPDRAAQARRAQ